MNFFVIILLSNLHLWSSVYPDDRKDIPEPFYPLCYRYSTHQNLRPQYFFPNSGDSYWRSRKDRPFSFFTNTLMPKDGGIFYMHVDVILAYKPLQYMNILTVTNLDQNKNFPS